ncbi:HupE/UreJ family protein [Mesorhizobium sp.]|uniref:HupE/UreJ family protein n=1 Tax=Mesorhizobium sp. TaxID=1871066 RepID=UPI0025D45DBA|nr:HupE/UreJ family protein [Mesorhizobium sp.]
MAVARCSNPSIVQGDCQATQAGDAGLLDGGDDRQHGLGKASPPGLLHRLGFAGALSEVGLPGHAIPVALLFFNIGVELGQLLFIAVVMALFAILRPLWFGVVRPGSSWSHTMPLIGSAYCIGGIASFWLIERVYGFWA